MTDEEIVARAIHANWYEDDIAPSLDYERSRGDAMAVERCERLSRAVVAALCEAGRMVPEGCVAVERKRIERMSGVVNWANRQIRNLPQTGEPIEIQPGDLEPLP